MIKNIIDKNLKNLGLKYWRVDKMFPHKRLILQMQANSVYTANVKACSQHVNRTELTFASSLVTRASVTTWLAAAKIGRLVLIQAILDTVFGSCCTQTINRCALLHWQWLCTTSWEASFQADRSHSSSRTAVRLSLVCVLRTSVNHSCWPAVNCYLPRLQEIRRKRSRTFVRLTDASAARRSHAGAML